jgi:hypothetical protein
MASEVVVFEGEVADLASTLAGQASLKGRGEPLDANKTLKEHLESIGIDPVTKGECNGQ